MRSDVTWPELDELMNLPVSFEENVEEPWEKQVTLWADDGTMVVVGWNEMLADASVLVSRDGRQLASATKLSMTALTLSRAKSGVCVSLRTQVADFSSVLTVVVGEVVTFDDLTSHGG